MQPPKILFAVDEWRQFGGAHRYLLDLMTAFADCPQRLVFGRRTAETTLPEGVPFLSSRALSSSLDNHRGLHKLDDWVAWADVICIQNIHNPLALAHLTRSNKGIFILQDHRFFCPSIGKTRVDGSKCSVVAEPIACADCFTDTDYMNKTLEIMARRRDALRDSPCVALSDYMAQEWHCITGHRPMVAPPWTTKRHGKAQRRGWLIAGRLTAHKNPSFAVDAWKLAGCPETLYIIGKGPEQFNFPGIKTLAWQDHTQFLDRLGQVRALLFPSKWQEPYGILGIESLASDTPVLACASGGMNAWMGKGTMAVNCVQEMAHEMQSILTEQARWNQKPFRAPSYWSHQRALSLGKWSALIVAVAAKNNAR